MGNKNKLPNAFTPDQLVQLFDVIDRPKVAMASALAFFCGLRISEVCNLKTDYVDLNTKRLKVVNSKSPLRGKTGYGKDRYVPLPDQIISPLRRWIEIIHGGKWLFPSDKSPDTPLRKKSLYEQYRIFLQRAGLEFPEEKLEYTVKINGKKEDRVVIRHRYNFHTLRHSYGTYLRNKGVSLEDIRDLMGHERFDTTLVYAKISHVQKKNAIHQAFSTQQRSEIIPEKEVKRLSMPDPGNSPVQYLQMQMLKGDISAEEYQEKARLLQMNFPNQIQ